MKTHTFSSLGVALLGGMCLMVSPIYAASEPFVGEIMMTGANYCPRGWANADGQLLPINQNQALFALLGVNYGGDGRTTFGLPDLRGRVAIHAGNGPGLTQRAQGEKGGEEQHTLVASEAPSSQPASDSTSRGNIQSAGSGRAWAVQGGGADLRRPGAGPLNPRRHLPQAASGTGAPHNVMQPFLSVRFCIALQGIFPSRN
ncbi:MAG: phage tail protein [Nitrospirales bacterium]